jgi:hypothetical protein
VRYGLSVTTKSGRHRRISREHVHLDASARPAPLLTAGVVTLDLGPAATHD